VELHALAAGFQVHAIEHSDKVEMPEGTARLAVCNRLQAYILLHLDQPGDFEVFDGVQFGGGKILRPGFGNAAGTKEAPHMIGAEWRCAHIDPLVWLIASHIFVPEINSGCHAR
jgi:hypothetical protein